MSRLFDGVDDQMVYTVPASGVDVNGAHTLLIVVRQIATSNTIWQSYIETQTSAAGAAATLGRNNSGQIYWAQGVTATSAISMSSTDNWVVAAARKTAGSSIPTFSKCVVGGSNTHTAGGGTLVVSPSIASGTIRIGGNDDFANIRVAAAALFNRVLSDSEINGINSALTTQSIYDLTPVWLVDDADFSVDLMGNANRTSITGTADDADDPSGWVYGIAGGTSATVTAVVSDALADATSGGVTASSGTDIFDYANGTLGAPWLAWTSTMPTIASGVATAPSGLVDASYPVVSDSADTQMEAIFASNWNPSLNDGFSYGVGTRLTAHSSSADGYAFEIVSSATGAARLYKGAAFTQLGSSASLAGKTAIEGIKLTTVGSTITGYVRESGVWNQVITATDSTYTAAGYPGFWLSSSVIGITSVSWGTATAGTDATVTAVVSDATAAAPIAGTTLTANATVTAVAATALADAPAATVTQGGVVGAVPAVAAASAPPANQLISAVINAPATVALASAPIAAVGVGNSDATVTAVPAVALGDAPFGFIAADGTVVGIVADATGTAPLGALTAAANVDAAVSDATAQAPRPALTPAPAGGNAGPSIATVFAEDSA